MTDWPLSADGNYILAHGGWYRVSDRSGPYAIDGNGIATLLNAGRVSSGITASADFTPIAGVYGAGDIQDVAKQLNFVYAASGLAVPAGCLIRILSSVLKIPLSSVPSGQTSFTGQLYSIAPPSARIDNDHWSRPSGDLNASRGPIALGTPVKEDAASTSLYVKNNIDTEINLAAGLSSAFMELVTDGAHTVAASPPVRTVILYGIVL